MAESPRGEVSEPGQPERLREDYDSQLLSLFLASAIIVFIVSLTLSVYSFSRLIEEGGNILTASMAIVGLIVAYLILALFAIPIRWIPLAAALGAHLGFVTIYYSNPLILPLIIVERLGDKASINIDIVQLAVAYEIVTLYLSRPPQNSKSKQQTPQAQPQTPETPQ
ncbi:MAG: hypothetical protein P3X22_006415 [Thermoprotei archaeon]|nr:hypothetical protein [Thermoprotei archaeon]